MNSSLEAATQQLDHEIQTQQESNYWLRSRAAGAVLGLLALAGCSPAAGSTADNLQAHDERAQPATIATMHVLPTPTMWARPVHKRAEAPHTVSPSPTAETQQPAQHPRSVQKPARHHQVQTASSTPTAEGVFNPREQRCLSGVMTIVHRGMGIGKPVFDGQVYPEDTFKAFKKGMELGVCGYETDYWNTDEGLLISQHDKTLERMTNGNGLTIHWTPESGIHGPAGTDIQTMKEILLESQSFDTCFRQEELKQRHIPTEVLRRIIHLNNKFVKDPQCVLFTASNAETLCKIKEIDDRYPTALINRQNDERFKLDTVPTECVDVLNQDFKVLDKRYVRKAKALDLQNSARNVDRVRDFKRAKEIGVERIVTNEPWNIGDRS